MKAKRTAPSRRRVSFAVDRAEIEINSDWVDAVMNPVVTPPPREPAPLPEVHFPAPPDSEGSAVLPSPLVPVPEVASDPAEPPFFAAEENNATGAESATGERCTSVENSAAVDNTAPVAQIAAVEDRASVEEGSTVADLATVEGQATVETRISERTSPVQGHLSVEYSATVEDKTTGEDYATEALSSSTKDHRIPRPRPILRVTDGLTPGQYAVYSLMFEAGEGSPDTSPSTARIYNGGYADLGRLTGLSKRGIQNIVAELQAKHVIRLHRQPGYHRTETSAYLVPDPESVVRAWFTNGWRHALGKSKTLVP